jgi:hypothetical protein
MHSSGVHSCILWMELGYSAGTQFGLTYLHSNDFGVRLARYTKYVISERKSETW